MPGLAVRSVQLMPGTTEAWKDAGVQFARRGRTVDQIMRMALEQGYEFVLNLGKSTFTPDISGRPGFVWNNGRDIAPLLWPGASRELFGDLMPDQPTSFPVDVWIKAPGMRGKGKFKKAITHPLSLPQEWDWQRHTVGQEYRLLTVGRRVVQSFQKHGVGPGDRNYVWVGLTDTPIEVKRIVRKAARRLNGLNVIGWDVVAPDFQEPRIFEGNGCPGVNTETATRIVTEIRRQIGDLQHADN